MKDSSLDVNTAIDFGENNGIVSILANKAKYCRLLGDTYPELQDALRTNVQPSMQQKMGTFELQIRSGGESEFSWRGLNFRLGFRDEHILRLVPVSFRRRNRRLWYPGRPAHGHKLYRNSC